MTTRTEEVKTLTRRVLAGHPVTFAMLIGSAARGDDAETSDVDIVVEFAGGVRKEGYSDVYLDLQADLETALEVDVAPVSAMGPRFAAVAFETGGRRDRDRGTPKRVSPAGCR